MERQMIARLALLVLGITSLGLPAAVAAGAAGSAACTEAKAKATGKKAAQLLKAFGQNTQKSNPTRLIADISKAQSTFGKAFTRAEAKASCRTVDDVLAIEAKADAFVADVLVQLSAVPTTTTSLPPTTTTTTLPSPLCGETFPQCDGSCSHYLFICAEDPGGSSCSCQLEFTCIVSDPLECGGSCPPGWGCVPILGFDYCNCRDFRCESRPPGACETGLCLAGGTCVDLGGVCGCAVK